jgi:hypothetical protein
VRLLAQIKDCALSVISSQVKLDTAALTAPQASPIDFSRFSPEELEQVRAALLLLARGRSDQRMIEAGPAKL